MKSSETQLKHNTDFDWPKDGVAKKSKDERWRRITNFSITENGKEVTLLQKPFARRNVILRGELVPRPDYIFRDTMEYEMKVTEFSIFFGVSKKDSMRFLSFFPPPF